MNVRPLVCRDEPPVQTLAVEGFEDRSLLLAAVGGLILELVDDPRGPSQQSVHDACAVAAQLVRGAPVVHIPVGIVSVFARHVGERLAVMRPA